MAKFLLLAFLLFLTDHAYSKKWCVVYLGKYDQIWVRSVKKVRGSLHLIDLEGKQRVIKTHDYRGFKCY